LGWLLMGSVGALLGGLFLGFRDLLPYLAAQRSGVVVRKGARGLKVRREEDSEGFDRLLANRAKGAALGFGLSAAGVFVLSLFGLAFAGASGPLAIFIYAISITFGLFALFCLIRGFATGRMFSFWSLALYGEATLKQNPTWFWIYTALNFAIVAITVFPLLRLLQF
jgi:hypothetical protein